MTFELQLNEEILKHLGARLKPHRLNLRLSTQDLALKSGVSARTINGFERGEKNISLLNLIELLRVLGLVRRLEELIPELPKISPLEFIKIEKKQRKRIKR